MTDPQLYYLGLIFLVSIDLITAATRAGLQNARHVRMLPLDDQQEFEITPTLSLMSQLPRVRAALNFLRAVLWFLVAALVLLVFPLSQDAKASLVSIGGSLLLTALSLWLLELLVDWWVLRDPETWARRMTPFAQITLFLLRPILALPLALLGLTGTSTEDSGTLTEDEIKTLVEAGQREGVLEQDEREMIFSIFRFGDTLAREIMIPRIDVLALSHKTSLKEAVDALLNSGYSRVPVYDGSIDNILGLLYAKDLLRVWREGNQVENLQDLLRPAYFTPETKKVADLLQEMQARRIHMAIVVDEYGGTAGLVTLEDIVEEIIGEVQDEYDQAEEVLYQQVGDGEFVFHGRIDLDDFDAIMESQLANSEADTLGGYVYSKMGRVPKGGESFKTQDLLLTVEQVVRRRIRKVRAQRLPTILEREGASNADG